MKKALVSTIAIVVLTLSGCSYLTEDTLTATVTDKERITTRSTSRYLIYTDKETLQNSDIWIRGKFRSSDIYGKLEEGKTYDFVVCGQRIPLFNAYRNIIEVK